MRASAKHLQRSGHTLVYNMFPLPQERENQYVDEVGDLTDLSNVFDMRSHYARETNCAARNRMPRGLYQGAASAIAVQGGNSMIPIISHCPTRIVMRGSYDYPYCTSVSRIYATPVDCFHEPAHLLHHFDRTHQPH
ncbi:MAG: hypothetical protein J6386_18245 [Candidatus Synoicihabitans palmerolidicus]|nr:hypothetical protein [Candidatus Synoicihabitans palmerolidicus]